MQEPFNVGATATGPSGQQAHPDSIAHNALLERQLHRIGEHAWTLVGNGLSNQTFVEGPAGLIVIDTGECIEEMTDALAEIRRVTDAPIVACIYTHFHYVGGTKALEAEVTDFPIWGHAGIDANLKRFSGEISPRASRGLMHQFGVALPPEGSDALLNVGLGRFFRNPDHAPYTPGHIPATHTFDEPTRATIAGLDVHFYPAPSDATDSITIHFPALELVVNNLLWPALFNVFAIRGEEYRDPRILLAGLDTIFDLDAEHLAGTHGPPLSGRSEIALRVRNYRDSIQFLWDQTVRGANLGLTFDELIDFIKLPDCFGDHYTTEQYYGVAEHHIKQIYTGLFGWFDEDESRLFPTPAPERARRLIAGFGGLDTVRGQLDTALEEQDFRWALELGTWLVRADTNAVGRADGGALEDRARLAAALRGIGYATKSANIRNWCLTRARELTGEASLERFRQHRFQTEALSGPIAASVALLRVILIPERAVGIDTSVAVRFEDGTSAGLHVRNCVAVPTDGRATDLAIDTHREAWSRILGGKLTLPRAIEEGSVRTTTPDEVRALFGCFDLSSFSA